MEVQKPHIWCCVKWYVTMEEALYLLCTEQRSPIILPKTYLLQRRSLCIPCTQILIRSQSLKNLYIVKPEWITESVSSGKRLNESSFSLFSAKNTIQSMHISTWNRLHRFLSSKIAPKRILHTPTCLFKKPIPLDGSNQTWLARFGCLPLFRSKSTSSSLIITYSF